MGNITFYVAETPFYVAETPSDLVRPLLHVIMCVIIQSENSLTNEENIHLTESDPSCIQSILPVNCGGLGIRSAVQLAPSAFLASAAASSELAHMILPTNMQPTQLSYVDEALVIWSQGCQEQPLTGVAAHHQKSWDSLRLFSMADTLLKNTTDELNRARLLAASCKESGAWLNALPITSLGLRMDDTTIRISMGLRLGIPLCRNHIQLSTLWS